MLAWVLVQTGPDAVITIKIVNPWIEWEYLIVLQFDSSYTTNYYLSSAGYPFPEYTREIAGLVCKDRSELIQCQGETLLQCLMKAKPLCDNDLNCFGISYNLTRYIQFKETTTAKCTSKRLTGKFPIGGIIGALDGGSILKKEKGREKIFLSIYGWYYAFKRRPIFLPFDISSYLTFISSRWLFRHWWVCTGFK